MIRIGIIGCGAMGCNHLRNINAIDGRAHVTALVDTDADKVNAALQNAPEARGAADYREVTDIVDAVVIALPHDLHYDVASHFLKAGKHVLLEKPLALTEDECLKLIELDRSPDPMLMVGYPLRSDPMWLKLGELIRSEAFGKVFQVSIWTEQLTDTSRGAWLGQAKRLGGGQLFSHGCHYIDQLLLWLGKPISGTHMGTNRGTPWMEREGTSNVSIEFENNILAYHFGTWGARGSTLKYSVHIHCTEGMIEYAQHRKAIILHKNPDGGDPHYQPKPGESGEKLSPSETVIYKPDEVNTKAVGEQLINFIDCIEKGKPSPSPARDALESLRVVWRLYEAEEKGTIADLRGLGFAG